MANDILEVREGILPPEVLCVRLSMVLETSQREGLCYGSMRWLANAYAD